jgi:hypothetical protein
MMRPSLPKQHAFGVDDGRPHLVYDPSPVLGVGHFSQSLLDHFCRAPKPANILNTNFRQM